MRMNSSLFCGSEMDEGRVRRRRVAFDRTGVVPRFLRLVEMLGEVSGDLDSHFVYGWNRWVHASVVQIVLTDERAEFLQ